MMLTWKSTTMSMMVYHGKRRPRMSVWTPHAISREVTASTSSNAIVKPAEPGRVSELRVERFINLLFEH